MNELEKVLENYYTVYSICPKEVKSVINSVSSINKLSLKESKIQKETFLEHWTAWINHSQSLSFKGCETNNWAITNGIHDALTNQILYRSGSTFYTFYGDYQFYDILLEREIHKKIYLNDIEDILEKSYVIISIPNHCGSIPPEFKTLVKHAMNNDIKIFLDCAFYGTILKGVVDTSLSCFDAVAFSLSKPFLMGGIRTGIVFSNDLAPPLNEIMKHYYNYWNGNGVRIINAVMDNFYPDYMPLRYKGIQEKFCEIHNLDACDIFMLCRSDKQEYANYRRFNLTYARWCLTDIFIGEE